MQKLKNDINQKLIYFFMLLPMVLAIFFYNYALNRNYFMLVEGRSYIARAIQTIDGIGIIDWMMNITIHDFVTERVTNKIFYLFTSSICGIDYTCQQFFQILLIALTALIFGLFLRLLKVSTLYSILIPVLWVFSHSVIHAVHWQATALEKLLGFFTVSYLSAVVYLLSKPYSKKQAILSNIVLGVILLAALSAKEHSALLFPISILLISVFILNNSWSFKNSIRRIIFPLVITFIHGILFLKYIVFPVLLPATAGVYDGNPVSNFFMYMGFAFNSYENYDFYNSIVVYSIWGSFLALTVLEVKSCWVAKARLSLDYMLMVWAGLASLLFMAAMARLHYQNRYYLLVPSIFIYITAFFELKLWVKYLGNLFLYFKIVPSSVKQIFNQSAVMFVIIFIYLMIHVSYFFQYYHSDFKPFSIQSRNFIESRNVVENNIPNPLAQRLYFVSEVHGKIASILHSEFPPDIPRYIGAFWFQNRSYASGKQLESIKFVDMKDFVKDYQRESDAYYVIFDHELNVDEIDKGNTVIYLKEKNGK